jgi:hypothetical protein
MGYFRKFRPRDNAYNHLWFYIIYNAVERVLERFGGGFMGISSYWGVFYDGLYVANIF